MIAKTFNAISIEHFLHLVIKYYTQYFFRRYKSMHFVTNAKTSCNYHRLRRGRQVSYKKVDSALLVSRYSRIKSYKGLATVL